MDYLVGIGEYRIADAPSTVTTRGLGSCVGVIIYDCSRRAGGLAHVMLPNSKDFSTFTNPYKFADLAVPALHRELCLKGCSYMQAKIAGGAKMFTFSSDRSGFDIGMRNIEQVRRVLSELGVPLVASDVGGSWGRTVILNTETGITQVRTVGRGESEL
ncbi:MAG: chemotaxis protein CheD [Bacillota bacterium]|nr:MAG: chemotaxis protein CheD [Bacillota bacterium]